MPPLLTASLSEGLSGLVKNRSRIVPGRLNRILNALVPASLARKMEADLLGTRPKTRSCKRTGGGLINGLRMGRIMQQAIGLLGLRRWIDADRSFFASTLSIKFCYGCTH